MKYHVITGWSVCEGIAVSDFNSVDEARNYLKKCAYGFVEELGVGHDAVADSLKEGDFFRVSNGEQEFSGSIALTPFVEACLAGEASVDELDKYIEWWHTHDTGNELHEFLGISLEDYGCWVKTDDVSFFQTILDERKNQKTVDELVAHAVSRTQEGNSVRETVDLVK